MPISKSWLHCYDAAVPRADENKVNNILSYISFYNHIKFFSSYLFVRGLGFLSSSLGIATLHIPPVKLEVVIRFIWHTFIQSQAKPKPLFS